MLNAQHDGHRGPVDITVEQPHCGARAARDAAMFTAIVDLPTPPLPLPTATMFFTPFNAVLSICGACRTSAVILIVDILIRPAKPLTSATASSRIWSLTGHAGVVRFISNATLPLSILRLRMNPSETISLCRSGS